MSADSNNIDWNEVVKKEARGIDDADFGEVQMTMGDAVITEKGVTDKKRFYLPKSLADKFDGHTLWFRITEDEAYNTYRDIEETL
ncbi:MAG: hypothetical protein ACJ72Q_05400 [Nitrososphaeraceae archaeon]